LTQIVFLRKTEISENLRSSVVNIHFINHSLFKGDTPPS